MLYGEPGKASGFIVGSSYFISVTRSFIAEYLLGASFVMLFFPFFIFFCAHALVYLFKNGQAIL